MTVCLNMLTYINLNRFTPLLMYLSNYEVLLKRMAIAIIVLRHVRH